MEISKLSMQSEIMTLCLYIRLWFRRFPSASVHVWVINLSLNYCDMGQICPTKLGRNATGVGHRVGSCLWPWFSLPSLRKYSEISRQQCQVADSKKTFWAEVKVSATRDCFKETVSTKASASVKTLQFSPTKNLLLPHFEALNFTTEWQFCGYRSCIGTNWPWVH